MKDLNSIEEVQAAIEHGCDGPLTPFVLISRAMLVVQQQRARAPMAADALYSALHERGWVTDSDTLGECFGS